MILRALEKRDDLEAAIAALCTMKGVSPAFASAVLVAFRPEKVFLKHFLSPFIFCHNRLP